jgi:hypothetical protein
MGKGAALDESRKSKYERAKILVCRLCPGDVEVARAKQSLHAWDAHRKAMDPRHPEEYFRMPAPSSTPPALTVVRGGAR